MKFQHIALNVLKVAVELALAKPEKPNPVSRETGSAEDLADAIEGEYTVISVS